MMASFAEFSIPQLVGCFVGGAAIMYRQLRCERNPGSIWLVNILMEASFGAIGCLAFPIAAPFVVMGVAYEDYYRRKNASNKD
jgi:hypothetical protein